MHMCTILPQKHLGMIESMPYHMCLVHLLFQEGMQRYTEFYQNIGKDDNKFLIMDNGVIEGDQFSISNLCDVGESIHADEIILTDVLRNAEKTLSAIEKDIAYLYSRYVRHGRKIPFNLMVVPQGNSIDEWVQNAVDIVSNWPDYISTIGVPKHLISTCGTRDARLQAIAQLAERIHTADFDFHLLGCWENPLEVLSIARAAADGKIPMVRSCDSIIAYKYAEANQLFWEGDRPDSNPVNFKESCTENISTLATNIISWNAVGDPVEEHNARFITGPTIKSSLNDDLLYCIELMNDLKHRIETQQKTSGIRTANQIQAILAAHLEREVLK